MKTKFLQIIIILVTGSLLFSCSSSNGSSEDELVGQDGNPRFNLVFTNPDNVDLDLYVKTPSGAIISYSNPVADLGTLDVDCLCGDCTQGPNENIFWENGTAEAGTYEYWVNYFGDCGTVGSSSNFTLRVIRNGAVLETKTGSLNAEGDSTHWTFVQE